MGRYFPCLLLMAVIFGFAPQAEAIPTFQTYIDGGTAGDLGGDEDTWFLANTSFDLFVVGAYGPNTLSLNNVTLAISVPEGETGTISFTTSDEAPVLFTLTGQGTTVPENNPAADADIHILTDVGGDNGYSTKDFVPSSTTLNNHYPFQDSVSDFILFGLGSFDDVEGSLKDYNADTGVIGVTSATGEQKEYSVEFTDFSRVHFDVYGLVTESSGGNGNTRYHWEINPGSHDSTATTSVPEPGTMLLLGAGIASLGVAGRRVQRNR